MGCGSGCCAPDTDSVSSVANVANSTGRESGSVANIADGASTQAETKDECCQSADCHSASEQQESKLKDPAAIDACESEGCCAPTIVDADNKEEQGCCATAAPVVEASCRDECCIPTEATTAGPAVGTTCSDGCCSPSELTTAAPVVEPNCGDECCSSPEDTSAGDCQDPVCCRGKPSPCCDSSCLDRLALRECQGATTDTRASTSSVGSKRSHCDPQNRDGEPCSRHRRITRERYAARLDAIGCICRALLALGQASCCAPTTRSSIDRRQDSKESRGCGSATAKKRPQSRKSWDSQRSCAKGCCSTETKPGVPMETAKSATQRLVLTADPEKAATGSERVILSISGMTCTGCETKLSRTLGSHPAIQNLKTSLILSRAEFDLDIGTSSAAEIMKHLERTTEFKCDRVNNSGSAIDVMPPGGAQEFLKRDYPLGVLEMSLVDKDTVRVVFDAKIIGARDLLSTGFEADTPLKLAPPQVDPTLEAGSKHVRSVGYMTIVSILLTIPVLVLAWAPLPEHDVAYGSTSLALATIIQVTIVGPFYVTSLKSLMFSRVIEMDLLIVLSTTAAYVFSVVAFAYMISGHSLPTGEFFETSTLLVSLIMVGRWVSAFTRQKAVESISVRSLQAPVAIIVGRDGVETEIDARLLQYGDCFKVLPDSRVPTDGTVISGSSELDESMITGEVNPVEKNISSALVAGSINGPGTLVARLTRLPGENTISTIAKMVDEAKLSKPKTQAIADKIASYFVPVVLVLAVITFVTWIAVGIKVKNQSASDSAINAIIYAITVLIVSCPCAIGLAVPMVIVIASGVAADRGVIFKSAESIEIAHKTSHVVFDKTGTLTRGKLGVVSLDISDSPDGSSVTSLLLGLVGSVKHPVSTAVATHLESQSILGARVNDIKSLAGKGVEGTTSSGFVLRAGNSRWLGLSSNPRVLAVLEGGYTTFCFTINGSLAAVLGLEDSLRPDAQETISKLHERGIAVSLLSGDDEGAVRSVAEQLNLPASNVRSRCTPSDKQAYIQELLATPLPTKPGKKSRTPVVVFCGDGTNDAIALAQATIGIHINEGTDVAGSAADVVLMRPDLSGILTVINASRAAMRRVAFNFAWSFVYNLFAVLLAAGAFVNARIPPQYAGLGELVSVLPVIAAAVLLRWERI